MLVLHDCDLFVVIVMLTDLHTNCYIDPYLIMTTYISVGVSAFSYGLFEYDTGAL
jgi:hypothetical protein